MKRKSPGGPAQNKGGRNQLRIVGGQWRGRKLHFPSVEGLRPTPDRVRETLFNWLAAVIPGARCLDLFAGSGALGFEAGSRGAASVTLVDSSKEVAVQLADNVEMLSAESIEVVNQSALIWLQSQAGGHYDVVFLDPPFGRGLVAEAVTLLWQRGLLNERAWVYLEMGSDEMPPELPPNWELYRQKQAGQVCYRLYRVLSSGDKPEQTSIIAGI